MRRASISAAFHERSPSNHGQACCYRARFLGSCLPLIRPNFGSRLECSAVFKVFHPKATTERFDCTLSHSFTSTRSTPNVANGIACRKGIILLDNIVREPGDPSLPAD